MNKFELEELIFYKVGKIGFSLCQLSLVYALGVAVFNNCSPDQILYWSCGISKVNTYIICFLSFTGIALVAPVFIMGIVGGIVCLFIYLINQFKKIFV